MKPIPNIFFDLNKKGWIGVDLDGTLSTYGLTYIGPLWIGDPVPRMVEKVNQWIIEGKNIKIFTARVSKTWLDIIKNEVSEADVRKTIDDWCIKIFNRTFEITSEKDPYLVEIWDDIRLMPVERNTGRLITYVG